MENFRSMSCREGRGGKMERFNSNSNSNNNGGNGEQQTKSATGYTPNMQDLRSYSTSYATSSSDYSQNPNNLKEMKNQNQSNGDHNKSKRFSSSSRGGGWGLGDPELQRKKRVASYKVYTVEGKMKGSLRKSFRWIKNTCSQVVHGFR